AITQRPHPRRRPHRHPPRHWHRRLTLPLRVPVYNGARSRAGKPTSNPATHRELRRRRIDSDPRNVFAEQGREAAFAAADVKDWTSQLRRDHLVNVLR
ncbi:MAG: hypothetical protein ABJA81_03110, partial [Nocardioidaceae bacterium]